ncbi:unnamed protein product [Rhizophagus irregularis]|nr:unnamed protein product [Rhizophagus irregularis]CAB4412254.1 unnamed protein product [Rhizophagus irregularis]
MKFSIVPLRLYVTSISLIDNQRNLNLTKRTSSSLKLNLDEFSEMAGYRGDPSLGMIYLAKFKPTCVEL